MSAVEEHKAGTFCWIELGTTDTGAARNYYKDLFGWSDADVRPGLPDCEDRAGGILDDRHTADGEHIERLLQDRRAERFGFLRGLVGAHNTYVG